MIEAILHNQPKVISHSPSLVYIYLSKADKLSQLLWFIAQLIIDKYVHALITPKVSAML